MTTALEIITDAYRESNILGIGVIPNATHTTEALRRLNAIISSALGFEIGEGLTEWMVGTTNIVDSALITEPTEAVWTRPFANVRLMLNAQSAQRLYLPNNPSDGARIGVVDVLGTLANYPVTLDGNGLQIEGVSSIVLNTNDLTRTWFYRADLADWKRVATLVSSDPMPFPDEFDDAFVTMLAMRLNPRHGRVIDQATGMWLDRSLRALKARYRQKVIVPADYGAVAMTRTGYGNNYGRPFGRTPSGWMN